MWSKAGGQTEIIENGPEPEIPSFFFINSGVQRSGRVAGRTEIIKLDRDR